MGEMWLTGVLINITIAASNTTQYSPLLFLILNRFVGSLGAGATVGAGITIIVLLSCAVAIREEKGLGLGLGLGRSWSRKSS